MAPKLPICHFDAKMGILCANCESRLRKGEISQADVVVSKAIVQLAERVPELGKSTLRRGSEVGGSYLLEFDPADVPSLRGNPMVKSEFERVLGGKVWVVSAGGNDRRFLEEVLFPAKVLTVNTVWLPDGGKRTKVIVPARRSDRKFGDFDKLRDTVKPARGIELLVETEREAGFRAPG